MKPMPFCKIKCQRDRILARLVGGLMVWNRPNRIHTVCCGPLQIRLLSRSIKHPLLRKGHHLKVDQMRHLLTELAHHLYGQPRTAVHMGSYSSCSLSDTPFHRNSSPVQQTCFGQTRAMPGPIGDALLQGTALVWPKLCQEDCVKMQVRICIRRRKKPTVGLQDGPSQLECTEWSDAVDPAVEDSNIDPLSVQESISDAQSTQGSPIYS